MAEMITGIVAKARESFKDTTDIILVIAGSGSSANILALVKAYFPEQTANISDETLATAIGFALFYWGARLHPKIQPFGLGVLIASTGALSQEWLNSIWAMVMPKK